MTDAEGSLAKSAQGRSLRRDHGPAIERRRRAGILGWDARCGINCAARLERTERTQVTKPPTDAATDA